ncbi:MAG: hypothetical protein ACSLE0_03165, partial [Chitinophagaceae bacterium]
MFNIHLLPASFGDAILIEYGKEEPHYILIDGGPYFAIESVLKGIQRVAPNLIKLDLLVITHIDIDHIDGIIVMLNQNQLPFEIDEVWYNGFKEIGEVDSDLLGVLQGEMLSVLINRLHLAHNKVTGGKAIFVKDYTLLPEYSLADNLKITLISPGVEGLLKMGTKWKEEILEIGSREVVEERLRTDHRYDELPDDLLGEPTFEDWVKASEKPDRSPANGSSIGFIVEYDGKRCLFTGDTPTHYMLSALQPMLDVSNTSRLHFDAWKLAHHGSKKSTHSSLMKIISCPKILISSDGKRYKHPDKECIAKLLTHKDASVDLFFNYQSIYN